MNLIRTSPRQASPIRLVMRTKRAPESTPPLNSELERETKLAVEQDFRLPQLPGQRLPRRRFTSIYYDTPDHCLARSAITLRYRVEGRHAAWQLKLPRNGMRREIEMAGGMEEPPGRFVESLIVHLEGKKLVPVATLRTSRTGIRVRRSGDRAADVVLDTVSVLMGMHVVQQFRELEIEWRNCEEDLIQELVTTLRKGGAQSHDGRPKLFRALSLSYDLPAPPPGDAPVYDHLRHHLMRQVQALKRFDPGARLGGEAEDVHQMRVAIRRLRAIVRAIDRLVEPQWTGQMSSALTWLGQLFGLARDLDVQLEYFRKEATGLNVRDRRPLERFIRHLEEERDKAQQLLRDEMRSARYLGVLATLQEAAQEPVMLESKTTLREVAAGQFEKLRKAMRKLGRTCTNRDLHRIRIKAKRARYVAELAEPCVGRRAARFARAARDFQDLLGVHQDAVLAERYVRDFLKQSPGGRAAFVGGIMVARARQRCDDVRRTFRSSWERLKKRGNKAWR
ncbi:MAG TPA: CYTH and CHAD domain-containing protein [Nitrospiraceae bacterium]|nr:CYTH and CHAD domain-containing protein [Nitrospiraceae bacterium]